MSSVHDPKLWDNNDLPFGGGDGEGVAVPVGLHHQLHQRPHAQSNPRNMKNNPPSTTSSGQSQRMQEVLACNRGNRCCSCCYEAWLRIKSWDVAYLLLGLDSGSRSGWQCSCWPALVGRATAGACCCRRRTVSCLSRATHKAARSLVLPALGSDLQARTGRCFQEPGRRHLSAPPATNAVTFLSSKPLLRNTNLGVRRNDRPRTLMVDPVHHLSPTRLRLGALHLDLPLALDVGHAATVVHVHRL